MSVVHPVVLVDAKAISRIQFDHMSIDWRDVIRTKIDVQPRSLPATSAQISEPKMDAVGNPNSVLYIYTKQEEGDHFLALKNPVKFTRDLSSFLDRSP
jgi:hypothetical protein